MKQDSSFGVKKRILLLSVISLALAWHYIPMVGSDDISTRDMASLSSELRAAVAPIPEFADPELGNTVAELVARVGALEAENQRLSGELNQLLAQDGLLNTIIAHIRSLHAQSEATRRDVVEALMAPVPEVNNDTSAYDGESAGSVSPLQAGDSASTPLLTKARHTIVTPVVVTAPATVAAATPEKHTPKPPQADPQAGKTN